MTKSTKHHRQGDILFVKVDELPAEAKKKYDGVVARGETTGHAHRVDAGNLFALANTRMTNAIGGVAVAEADLFVGVPEGADVPSRIVHEEHAPITLEPGVWRVYRQREFDPLVGVRRVAD